MPENLNLPKPQTMTAVLEDKQEFNDRFIEYYFELKTPPTFDFIAGQYVSIKVAEDGTRRAYSVASLPSFNHGFRLLLDLAPNGVGTQFFKQLKFGVAVEVAGPLGHFIIDKTVDEQALVFVGTGSGVAPLKSMIEDLLMNQDKRPIRLYWGMRHEAELFWLEELEDLNEKYQNFEFYPVISKPTTEWSLSVGHVTDLILAHHFKEKTGFYLCGNTGMIQDVELVLTEQKNINNSNIHYEKYY